MRMHLKIGLLMLLISIISGLFWSGLLSAEPVENEFWTAAKNGDVERVGHLLDQGVDVNAPSRYGATALSYACHRGHLDVARVLLEAGANPQVQDSFYQATPLTWTIGGGHDQITLLLIKHGATGTGDTLRSAVSSGSLEIVRALLEVSDVDQETILSCRDSARDRNQVAIVKLLEESLDAANDIHVQVPLEILQSLTGTYCSDQGTEYTVDVQNETLRIASVYGAPVRLRATGPYEYKLFKTTYLFKSSEGQITHLERRTESGAVLFRRSPAEPDPEPTAPKKPRPAATAPIIQDDLAASSSHWPQFRGTGARGIADQQGAPVQWDAVTGTGVCWKTPIPGLALSCPIVWEDRVFLTTAVSEQETASLRTGLYGDVGSVEDDSLHAWRVLCLDLRTGEIEWDRTAHEGVPRQKRHSKASHANSTPATDGEHLVTLFGSEGLYCYDLQGQLLWKKDLGSLDSGWFYDREYQWGFASSPVIFEKMVFVQCDIQDQSFIAAFDIETGTELWRTERDEIPTWSTPCIWNRDRGPLVITNGSHFARAYNAHTGEEVWRLSGHSEIAVPTPLIAYNFAYVTSGYRHIKPIYAIHGSARGDISLADNATSNQHIAWSHDQGGPYLPCALVYRGYLYTCKNSGILSCYDALTGERVYQKRLRRSGARSFTASPVAADDKLFFTSEEGKVLVLQAGPDFKLLHVNSVDESCLATPAIAQGLFLLRGEQHLFAFGEPGHTASSD